MTSFLHFRILFLANLVRCNDRDKEIRRYTVPMSFVYWAGAIHSCILCAPLIPYILGTFTSTLVSRRREPICSSLVDFALAGLWRRHATVLSATGILVFLPSISINLSCRCTVFCMVLKFACDPLLTDHAVYLPSYFDTEHLRDGRAWPWIQRQKFWHVLNSYCNGEINVEEPLNSSKQYIFCQFPHGSCTYGLLKPFSNNEFITISRR